LPADLEGQVLSSRRETPTTWTVALSLKSRFTFFPGQYAQVALPIENDRRGSSRPFSIASSPTEVGRLQFTTRLSGSPFKVKFALLHVGDTVKLKAPLGRFMFDESLPGPAILLSGGIGITALRSMVRFVADRGIRKDVFLVACAREPADMLFRWELEPLQARHRQVHVMYKATRLPPGASWSGPTGRINEGDIRALTPAWQEAHYYYCGGAAFVDSIREMLVVLGVPTEQQHAEKFTGYP
jgi:ferredoxin-NADP reductase